MTRSVRIPRLICLLSVLVLASISTDVLAQDATKLRAINYRLSMSRPQSHLFEVAIEVDVDPTSKSPAKMDLQMPAWSPGRYGVFDFAKNVQEVKAFATLCPPPSSFSHLNCKDSPVPITRVDHQTWRVQLDKPGKAKVTYKVFGNDLSGTFSQLDERHANVNGASVFMYVVNHKQHPVKLQIDPPRSWRVVNGLTARPDQREWHFPNYETLVDTPTEIAPDWTRDEFQVDGKRYYVVVHSFGEEGGKRPALLRDIEKIVRAQVAMWGVPEFDSYTFLIHFAADDRSGDGMEHLNSTQIIEPGALAEPGIYESALATVSHEFFHIWNVKRLRPIELGPWDWTRPLNTRSLWIAEGITNYYGHLMMRRAGIWSDTQFFEREGLTVTGIENAPGSRLMSAEESSLSAPFIDDAPHAQRTNLGNTAISYYTKGELLGLVLDLIIRGRTNGKASLDDVMRRMYTNFYLRSPNATYYLRGRGYTPDDFERAASEVAGFDLSDFFKRYVRGVETPPYEEALRHVGLRLVRETAGEPFNAGIAMDWDNPGVSIAFVRNGSPAEDAGLQQDDEIITLSGRNVTVENWRSVLGRHKQGDKVPITLKRDRRTIETHLILGPPDRFEYRIEEREDATAGQKALRAVWLSLR